MHKSDEKKTIQNSKSTEKKEIPFNIPNKIKENHKRLDNINNLQTCSSKDTSSNMPTKKYVFDPDINIIKLCEIVTSSEWYIKDFDISSINLTEENFLKLKSEKIKTNDDKNNGINIRDNDYNQSLMRSITDETDETD